MDVKINLQWVPYELRRLGWLGLAMPLLILLPFVGLGGLMKVLGAPFLQVARIWTAGLELGLPLGAGIIAAAIAADEPGIDLQLSVETGYGTTLLRRLGLLVGWNGLVALVWSTLLALTASLVVPQPFPLGQLSWFAPLVWFVAAGALLALGLHSWVASTAILGALWTIENILHDVFLARNELEPFFFLMTTYAPDASDWLINRLELLSIAAVFILGFWLIVTQTEYVATRGEA